MTSYNEYLLTEGREHTLEEPRFNALKEKAEKLNEKFGKDFISIEILKENFRKDICSGVFYKQITFVLNHIYSHLNDWKVLAMKSFINDLVIMDIFEESSVISNYRNENFSCDHCSTNRARKTVFIIENIKTGEIKQVGKSCLKDFTGESITKFLKEIESIRLLFTVQESPLEFSSGYFSLINFFAMVNRQIEKGIPYKNKSFVRESTVEKSFENYAKDNLPLSDEEKEKAKKIMHWFVDLNKSSDKEFILNAVAIINSALNSNQLVDYELLFRVAFVPYNYKRFIDKKNQIQAFNKASEFKGGYISGNISERVFLHVRLLSIKPILRQAYTYYDEGISYLYTLIDKEGHKITWFSSKANKFFKEENLNKEFKIKGTIKKFSEFNGLEQTELTRCFVSEI